MILYRAEKGNMGFFIQPSMIEEYSKLGYSIVKMQKKTVENIKEEVNSISKKVDSSL